MCVPRSLRSLVCLPLTTSFMVLNLLTNNQLTGSLLVRSSVAWYFLCSALVTFWCSLTGLRVRYCIIDITTDINIHNYIDLCYDCCVNCRQCTLLILVVFQGNKTHKAPREMLSADNKAFVGTCSVRLCYGFMSLLAV